MSDMTRIVLNIKDRDHLFATEMKREKEGKFILPCWQKVTEADRPRLSGFFVFNRERGPQLLRFHVK